MAASFRKSPIIRVDDVHSFKNFVRTIANDRDHSRHKERCRSLYREMNSSKK